MRMEIRYTRKFRNHYRNADKEIRTAFAHTLELFLEQPHHPALRNHALTGIFSGYRSIDVTEDWRAVFKETARGDHLVVTFHQLGTHQTLYG